MAQLSSSASSFADVTLGGGGGGGGGGGSEGKDAARSETKGEEKIPGIESLFAAAPSFSSSSPPSLSSTPLPATEVASTCAETVLAAATATTTTLLSATLPPLSSSSSSSSSSSRIANNRAAAALAEATRRAKIKEAQARRVEEVQETNPALIKMSLDRKREQEAMLCKHEALVAAVDIGRCARVACVRISRRITDAGVYYRFECSAGCRLIYHKACWDAITRYVYLSPMPMRGRLCAFCAF